MPYRAESREPWPGHPVTHAQIEPRGGIVDEHAQLQFAQPALARPAMRHVEQERPGAMPAVTLGDLHVAYVQRVALFRDAQDADRLAIEFENEILRLAVAREKKIAAPDEMMPPIVAAHVVARERLGELEVVHGGVAQLETRGDIVRSKHGKRLASIAESRLRYDTARASAMAVCP
jgi:hypothetical protein